MPGNTLQITAVATIGTGSLGAFGQSWHGIVVRVPVGETIGSQQINHIPRCKTLALGRSGFTRFKLVFDRFPAPSPGQRQGHPAGRQLAVQAQRNKQIAGVIQAVGLNHLYPLTAAAHRAAGQILAINHQLQLLMPHARPPERRLNPLDRAGISRSRGHRGIDCQYHHGARPFTATPLLCCVHYISPCIEFFAREYVSMMLVFSLLPPQIVLVVFQGCMLFQAGALKKVTAYVFIRHALDCIRIHRCSYCKFPLIRITLNCAAKPLKTP